MRDGGRRRRFRGGLAGALAGALLAGCAADGPAPGPSCPRMAAAAHTEDLVRFLPGPGRDVTDVVFRSRLAGVEGGCEARDAAVDVEMTVEFVVERGPADRDGRASFEYFVAIPQFRPLAEGKKRFPVSVRFPEGRSSVRHRDRVAVRIPLGESETGAGFEIFVGHQLTAEDLARNRRAAGR